METSTSSSLMDNLQNFLSNTSFPHFSLGHAALIFLGFVLFYLAIKREYEPLLLIPIGFGLILGNIPFSLGFQLRITESGSVLNQLFQGLSSGLYPALIFLGLGALTDFSPIISNPKLLFIGVAAQLGIIVSFLIASSVGLTPQEAGAIGMVGSTNGPVAIFLSSKLTPELIGSIAVITYILMALVNISQPPIMKLLTTGRERAIKMKAPRQVTQREKILFPIIGFLLIVLLVPKSITLIGMLFLGNLLKESTVTKRLADTVKGPMIDLATILIGLTIGASLQVSIFESSKILWIIAIGISSFYVSTIAGILFIKILNLFLSSGNKINPLIGNAGVSAVPDSARVSQVVGLEYDNNNHLLMHAMGPNVAGVIGSAVAAGILLSFLA